MQYQFKIQIKGITKPPVWRRFSISANSSFYEFHVAIQVTFGWENAHLFHFSPDGYRDPVIKNIHEDDWDFGESLEADDVKLSKIFFSEKQKFTYVYDFGDNWFHQIVLEKILPEVTLYPRLLAGKGECPPEDCGGVWGYEDLKEALSDVNNPNYEDLAEWMGFDDGETWNPKEFDLEGKQKFLIKVFKDIQNDE